MNATNIKDNVLYQNGRTCVLLFSGGRDSTLSALRLSKNFSKLALVTITSEHLHGMESVYQRLKELQNHLPDNTEWFHIVQPSNLNTDISFYAPTCLPCHHAYISVGVVIAEKIQAQHISFGYVGYQSTWPEQTNYAIEHLRELLKLYDITLELPVYGINKVEEVYAELSKYGISTISLEQKCTRQVNNVELVSDVLRKEISSWKKSIIQSLATRNNLHIEILQECQLKDLAGI